MQTNAYLSFDGSCAEAFAFYASVLGGEITMRMNYGGSPMAGQIPPGWGEKIMHARVAFGGQVLMGSDSPPGRYETPRGIVLNINADSAEEAETMFAAMAEGGTVTMPIAETFWAHRFGMLTDRFGIPWMVNCEKTP